MVTEREYTKNDVSTSREPHPSTTCYKVASRGSGASFSNISYHTWARGPDLYAPTGLRGEVHPSKEHVEPTVTTPEQFVALRPHVCERSPPSQPSSVFVLVMVVDVEEVPVRVMEPAKVDSVELELHVRVMGPTEDVVEELSVEVELDVCVVSVLDVVELPEEVCVTEVVVEVVLELCVEVELNVCVLELPADVVLELSVDVELEVCVLEVCVLEIEVNIVLDAAIVVVLLHVEELVLAVVLAVVRDVEDSVVILRWLVEIVLVTSEVLEELEVLVPVGLLVVLECVALVVLLVVLPVLVVVVLPLQATGRMPQCIYADLHEQLCLSALLMPRMSPTPIVSKPLSSRAAHSKTPEGKLLDTTRSEAFCSPKPCTEQVTLMSAAEALEELEELEDLEHNEHPRSTIVADGPAIAKISSCTIGEEADVK